MSSLPSWKEIIVCVKNAEIIGFFDCDYFLVQSWPKLASKLSPHQVSKYLKLQPPLKSRKMIISS